MTWQLGDAAMTWSCQRCSEYQAYEPLPSVFPRTQSPMAPLFWGGEDTATRRLQQGVGPPHGPPNLIQLVLLVNLLVFLLILLVNLLIIIEQIACNLITVFVIFFHVVIQTCTCFFSRFLLSRNHKIQIVCHTTADLLRHRTWIWFHLRDIQTGSKVASERDLKRCQGIPGKTRVPTAQGIQGLQQLCCA